MRGFAVPGQLALPLVATARAVARIRIDPFGLLALDPGQTVVLDPVPIPAPGGLATLPLQMPGDPSLKGRTLFSQSLILPSAAPRDWRFANLVLDPFLR